MPEDKCQQAEDVRPTVKDLTLAMIRNAKADVIIQLDNAYQRPNEDPRGVRHLPAHSRTAIGGVARAQGDVLERAGRARAEKRNEP